MQQVGFNKYKGTFTAEGITAIADALRVTGSLTSCNVLKNNLDVTAANLLVEAVKDNGWEAWRQDGSAS